MKLSEYFPAKEWNVYREKNLAQIANYLEPGGGVTTWGQGPIGETGYFQLVTASAQHKGDKRLAIVARVTDVEKARRINSPKGIGVPA